MRQLKNRLYTVSTLVPLGSRVADIGTDHGHLPIYLIRENISPFCIASDIKEKPLLNAETNIRRCGAENISVRLGAGLDTVQPNEVDCIVIAGMGGEVISSILEAAPWVKSDCYTLILQPMTSADALRRYLCENGFVIESETAVEENRKLYTVISAKFSDNRFTPDEVFLRTGRLDPDEPTARRYIEKQARIVADSIKQRASAGLDTKQLDAVHSKIVGLLG